MAAGREKMRLDRLLVERNFFPSRSRAAAEIMAGNIYVDGVRVEKPGTPVKAEAAIEMRGRETPYVSRGGAKLEKALREFAIELRGRTVLDIGASTGGFTHCALLHGASRVYALDVGYGQLDWTLRNDPRVVSMERKNVRHLVRDDLPEIPDVATVDVSFISLRLVFPVLDALGIEEVLCLVKPQFEASPREVGKKGVVKSPQVHEAVLETTVAEAGKRSYILKGLTYSPLKGPQGNIEYLAYFRRWRGEEEKAPPAGGGEARADIASVVSRAREALGEGRFSI